MRVIRRGVSVIWNKDAAIGKLFKRETDLFSKYIKANERFLTVRGRNYNYVNGEKTRIGLELEVLV